MVHFCAKFEERDKVFLFGSHRRLRFRSFSSIESRVRSKLNRLFYDKIQGLPGDEALLKNTAHGTRGAIIETGGTYTLIKATAVKYNSKKRTLPKETACKCR
jgi:hypothetical protein